MMLSAAKRAIIRGAQREHSKDKRFVITAKFAGRAAGLDSTLASNAITSLHKEGYLRDTGLRDRENPGHPRLFEPTKKLIQEIVQDELDVRAELATQAQLELIASTLMPAPGKPTSPMGQEILGYIREQRVFRGGMMRTALEVLRDVLKEDTELRRLLAQVDTDKSRMVAH